jgi:4-hydroxybenzoate polyprenyltransferase
VFWYSLAKRFTTWTQLFLGLAMAVAPVGGWLAVGGRGGWEPVAAGRSDRHLGRRLRRAVRVPGSRVRSRARPALDSGAVRRPHVARHLARHAHRRGVVPAGARGRHARSAACIWPASPRWRRCWVYEQSLVRADDLSQVKRAFDLNGYVGILYLLVLAVSLYGPWQH